MGNEYASANYICTMAATKNIIFDLGGVLLNLNYQKTIDAFKNLGIKNFEEMFSQFKADELFEKLETGHITEDDFYTTVKNRTNVIISNTDIKDAWNAMLLDFRAESLAFLESLSPQYKIYLLSNTNSIHLKCFRKIFTKQTGEPSLDKYFIKSWYSNEVGLRKPHKEIYEFVLQDENLAAEETLFIDDTLINIEGAKALGIKTHHLLPTEKIENIKL